MKKILFTLVAFFCLMLSYGQEKHVTGTVTDSETGMPIPGANVMVKNTTKGVVTDFDGNYAIDVNANATLVFTYIGYKEQEVTVGSQSVVDVTMTVSASELDEVVVVAYGTQTKEEVTAAVATVSGKELTDVTTPDVSTMLQGKVAGVQVVQSSGQPGSVPDVRIRGISSIDGRVSPLWVVDGVIMHGTPNLNPNEIESISVLKDASATSLYGSRGANGVVVVTTKRAKSGRSEITLSTRTGFSNFNHGNFEVMNSQQMYGYYQAFGDSFNKEDNPWFNEELLQRDYNWLDNGTQTGVVQDHNIVFTSGSEKSNTYISLGYYDETGTIKGYDFDKLSFRINQDLNFGDRLKISPKIGVNYNTVENRQHSLYAMQTYMPWDYPYNDEGNIVNPQENGVPWIGRDKSNYLYDLQWNYSNSQELNLLANFDFEFKITDRLKFISTNGYTLYRYDSKSYTDPASNSGLADDGRLYQYTSRRITRFTNQMLKYANLWGKHNFTALAAYEYNDYVYDDFSATGAGIVSGTEILNNAANPKDIGGLKNDYALQSFLFNTNYGYDDRYMVQLSIRRDGASNFGSNNQYGTFYSASAGWNIHNEDFFNIEAINELKLRGSYGAVGNRPSSLYPQYDLYSLSNTYNGVPVTTPSQLGNEDVGWEKSYQTNLGLDISFLNRIGLTFDYYSKDTSDLLYYVSIPDVTGYSGYWENIGGVKNSGFEIFLDADIISTEDFLWSFNFNIGVNKNEITELYEGEPIIRGNKRLNVGQDINTWFMRKWAGVDPENGDPLWEVVNEETGEITTTNNWNEATQQEVGTSTPDYYGGFGTAFTYKGISLSANFAFSNDNLIYNYSRELYDADGAYPTYNQQVLDNGWSRWQEPGDQATHPRPVYGGNNLSNKTSSRYLEDGSYLRMRNIRLGYTFSPDWIHTIGMSNLNIYLSGDNLWTITDYSGMDPEVGVDGTNDTRYPVSKRLTIGLTASF
ncbi:SusC/RagA family TonB-linked outer membrane protein [Galbibacter pacificus]|uniref:TonB-dependent receptor n=1 Tax=Galbibacter pacificus TaxID=2996052 RepID=A0ABT6FUK7_9FLAO|nr:TonB-dependent receptor [Galbibacter pacificus]MDG3583566.1 TonB-dependent receptor [Galbibacter pacificus]MDG3586958.1 TonB-dependent receptor [Galbibacter pacificus]